jgi:penicillin-binding protein 2
VKKYFTGLDFKAGAKTGSAQVSSNTQSHAVFVCFAPYENPEVAMAIVVEHGGSGGELAAIASDVLSYYFSARETHEAIPEENTLIR